MKINTFWNILLRAIGLWLLINSLYVLPQFATNLLLIGIPADGSSNTLSVIGLSVLAFIVYISIASIFLLKSNYLVTKLKLDKKFSEDTISLTLHQNQLLSVIIILIGSIMLLEAFPSFIRHFLEFLQQKLVLNQYPNVSWMVYQFLNVLIGYLLITNSKFISKLIIKKNEE